MGWLPNRLPVVVAWLQIDVPACRALAVMWFERGAALISPGIGMPVTAHRPREQERGRSWQ